jgi:predicted nucleic acid-binding protein
VVIDTNIVLRYLLRDNDELFKNASEIIESGDSIEITDLVISEAVYVLGGDNYRRDRVQISKALGIFLQKNNVNSASGIGRKYLKIYGNTELDLVDCYLIAYAIEHKVELQTFDKKMLKIYEQEKAKNS